MLNHRTPIIFAATQIYHFCLYPPVIKRGNGTLTIDNILFLIFPVQTYIHRGFATAFFDYLRHGSLSAEATYLCDTIKPQMVALRAAVDKAEGASRMGKDGMLMG